MVNISKIIAMMGFLQSCEVCAWESEGCAIYTLLGDIVTRPRFNV